MSQRKQNKLKRRGINLATRFSPICLAGLGSAMVEDDTGDYVEWKEYYQVVADREHFLIKKKKISEMYGTLLREHEVLKALVRKYEKENMS